jgi:prepilin-type N-terminal cleavage/methylation domain-containing protein
MTFHESKANAAGATMKTATHRRGFSLVELLVVITLIVMLIAMMGTALNAARASGNKQKTKASIKMLDEIIQRHFRSTESMSVAANIPASGRGAAIRKQITADMPDHWDEVRHMKANAGDFGSARQRGYVATLDAISPSNTFADAECLFMIIMQGGLADCIDCSGLGSIPVGDKDNDGAPEFLDAWGEPIQYVLWPGGFQLPIGSNFFDQTTPPFDGAGSGAEGGTMRPLLVSGGPSKLPSIGIHPDGVSYLSLNASGDPANSDIRQQGGFSSSVGDYRSDNITNFDDEVKQ